MGSSGKFRRFEAQKGELERKRDHSSKSREYTENSDLSTLQDLTSEMEYSYRKNLESLSNKLKQINKKPKSRAEGMLLMLPYI